LFVGLGSYFRFFFLAFIINDNGIGTLLEVK